MVDVVVAGGSVAGLATGLFAARRGHRVTVVERDGPPPPGDADAVVDGWEHPGVTQARQPHNLLARGARVLRDDAPDVLESLLARGAEKSYGMGLDPTGPDGDHGVLLRRLVLDAALCDAVDRQDGVTVRRDAVASLVAADGPGPPVVTGVRLESGAELAADVVVDCTGRRSPARRWLADIGAEMPSAREQPCGYRYVSRYYRLRDGEEFPSLDVPILSDLGHIMGFAFPADNRTYALLLVASNDDPLRRTFVDEPGFEAALMAIPLTREWRELGTPISPPATMAKIENRWSRLVDYSGPVVGGFVLVGDSSMHTNPTMGRGASLALAQAQRFASTAERVVDDPARFVGSFDQWTADNLGVWFDSQVALDQNNLDKFARALAGQDPQGPMDPLSRTTAGLFQVAETNDVVATALSRVANLLVSPVDLMADEEVVGAITSFLAAEPDLTPVFDPPGRAEFESLVVGM